MPQVGAPKNSNKKFMNYYPANFPIQSSIHIEKTLCDLRYAIEQTTRNISLQIDANCTERMNVKPGDIILSPDFNEVEYQFDCIKNQIEKLSNLARTYRAQWELVCKEFPLSLTPKSPNYENTDIAELAGN